MSLDTTYNQLNNGSQRGGKALVVSTVSARPAFLERVEKWQKDKYSMIYGVVYATRNYPSLNHCTKRLGAVFTGAVAINVQYG